MQSNHAHSVASRNHTIDPETRRTLHSSIWQWVHLARKREENNVIFLHIQGKYQVISGKSAHEWFKWLEHLPLTQCSLVTTWPLTFAHRSHTGMRRRGLTFTKSLESLSASRGVKIHTHRHTVCKHIYTKWTLHHAQVYTEGSERKRLASWINHVSVQ